MLHLPQRAACVRDASITVTLVTFYLVFIICRSTGMNVMNTSAKVGRKKEKHFLSNKLVLTVPALICPADSSHLLPCARVSTHVCVCVRALFAPLNEETKEAPSL